MERQPTLVKILDKLSEGKPYEVYVKGKWEVRLVIIYFLS